MALKDLSQDGGSKCESLLLDAAFNGLSRQSRAPRGAVLHSLEREILQTPVKPLDTVQVSPYRISRVIDVEGNVHVIRQVRLMYTSFGTYFIFIWQFSYMFSFFSLYLFDSLSSYLSINFCSVFSFFLSFCHFFWFSR